MDKRFLPHPKDILAHGPMYCMLPKQQSKHSDIVPLAFYHNWLSRYPRPFTVISDNNSEFIYLEFQSQAIPQPTL